MASSHTLSQLMAFVSATVNQDPTTPTVGGTDWNLWLSYMQRAQDEWQEAHDWEETRKTFWPSVSGLSNATIPLPSDWYRPAGPPINWTQNTSQGAPWPQILPEERTLNSVTDRFFYILGDQNNGFSMIWSPPTLASGTTVEIPYFAIAPSLASSGQVPLMVDSQFLVDRTIAYVLEARYDPRFQEFEAKSRAKLLQLIENHDSRKWSSYSNKTPVRTQERLQGFRLGRD